MSHFLFIRYILHLVQRLSTARRQNSACSRLGKQRSICSSYYETTYILIVFHHCRSFYFRDRVSRVRGGKCRLMRAQCTYSRVFNIRSGDEPKFSRAFLSRSRDVFCREGRSYTAHRSSDAAIHVNGFNRPEVMRSNRRQAFYDRPSQMILPISNSWNNKYVIFVCIVCTHSISKTQQQFIIYLLANIDLGFYVKPNILCYLMIYKFNATIILYLQKIRYQAYEHILNLHEQDWTMNDVHFSCDDMKYISDISVNHLFDNA